MVRGVKSASIRHVHLDGKENEKILSYIKRKHVGAKNSEKLSKTFLFHSNKGPSGDFNHNSTPDCMISSRVSPMC